VRANQDIRGGDHQVLSGEHASEAEKEWGLISGCQRFSISAFQHFSFFPLTTKHSKR
jgi:hypothetical protein